MTKTEMMLLNDIIYKIYTIEDFDEMRTSMLTSLQFLIPYEAVTYYLSVPGSSYQLADPIGVGLTQDDLNKYLTEYEAMDYTRWTFASPTAMVYRETDLLSEEIRVNTPYYKNAFEHVGFHYSAIITIIYEGKLCGCINFFRTKEQGDFTDEEMTYMDLIKTHLCYRTYKHSAANDEKKRKYPDSDHLMEAFNFTRREIEIIHLLIDGISREDLCEKLSISPNTLKKHTSNIYRKAGVSSWRELHSLLEDADTKE